MNSGGDGAATDWVTVTAKAPGVTISPFALTLTEGGSAETYTVALDTMPSGNVTVTSGSEGEDAGAVTLSPAALYLYNHQLGYSPEYDRHGSG